MKYPIDIAGQRFGRLVVRAYRGDKRWECVCDCGKAAVVRGEYLRTGRTKSCGCFRGEVSGARGRAQLRTHGESRTKTWRAWIAMRDRCLRAEHPAYHNYGGRGIRCCERWASYENFLADMGHAPPGLTLDRIDNNGNYEHGNCRWATRIVNSNNTRTNVILNIAGKRFTVAEAARAYEINYATLYWRLSRGMNATEAIAPVTRKGE